MSTWRDYLAAGALAIGCLLGTLDRSEHVEAPSAKLEAIPAVLGEHRGVDEALPEEQLRVAGVSDHIFRRYSSGEHTSFSLYVGYYAAQTSGRSIHSPRNCLPGAGWQTVELGRSTIATSLGESEVNRVILAREQQRAIVYYWYQGRGRVAASEYLVKWQLLRDAALTGRTEEALVRIVVPIDHERHGAEAVAVADRIARGAATRVLPAVQEVLPGAASRVADGPPLPSVGAEAIGSGAGAATSM